MTVLGPSLDTADVISEPSTMLSKIHRRTALNMIGSTFVVPMLSLSAAFQTAKPPQSKWKTAIGLNGFQSGSRKYKNNYPLKTTTSTVPSHSRS
jgi:hypothetical protein